MELLLSFFLILQGGLGGTYTQRPPPKVELKLALKLELKPSHFVSACLIWQFLLSVSLFSFKWGFRVRNSVRITCFSLIQT